MNTKKKSIDEQYVIAKAIIEDFKISKNLIAVKLGLTHGTITEKFAETRYSKFSESQKVKIIELVKKIGKKISLLN